MKVYGKKPAEDRSRQDDALKLRILFEPVVQGYQLPIRRPREGCQVSVAPKIRRKSPTSRVGTPMELQSSGLVAENHSWVTQEAVILFPCLRQRHGLLAKCTRICSQPQKSLLR